MRHYNQPDKVDLGDKDSDGEGDQVGEGGDGDRHASVLHHLERA